MARRAQGKRVLIDHPDRLDGVTAIGVDERVRRRTGRGGKCVTVIHRPHRDPRRHRPGAIVGHGRGPLQAGVQDLVG